MSKASQSQQQIKGLFTSRPILYMPGLAILFGVNEAILISQLLYWRGKGHRRDNSFYKTHDELYLETGLTRDKQDRAIKKFKKLGVLETKNKGVPQKRHFYIDVDALVIVITELLETDTYKGLEISSGFATFQQSITEITQKITTKTTPKITSNILNKRNQTEQLGEIMVRRFDRQKDIYDI